MRLRFPKSHRLLLRSEYQRMRSARQHYAGTFLLIDLRRNHLLHSRLGITASKKFGNACKRNRFKRLVREAFRLSLNQLPQGIDIHVRPRGKVYNATRNGVMEDIRKCYDLNFSQPALVAVQCS